MKRIDLFEEKIAAVTSQFIAYGNQVEIQNEKSRDNVFQKLKAVAIHMFRLSEYCSSVKKSGNIDDLIAVMIELNKAVQASVVEVSNAMRDTRNGSDTGVDDDAFRNFMADIPCVLDNIPERLKSEAHKIFRLLSDLAKWLSKEGGVDLNEEVKPDEDDALSEWDWASRKEPHITLLDEYMKQCDPKWQTKAPDRIRGVTVSRVKPTGAGASLLNGIIATLQSKPRQSAQLMPIKEEDFAAAEKATMFVYKINKPDGRKWEQGEILVRISKNPIGEGTTHSIYRGHVISSSKESQAPSEFVLRMKKEKVLPVPASPKLGSRVSKKEEPSPKEATKDTIRLQMHEAFYQASAQALTMQMAESFNALRPPKAVKFVEGFVLQLPNRKGQQFFNCEVFINGKFIRHYDSTVTNFGLSRTTPQAFAHYSYELSNNSVIVTNLRGVNNSYSHPTVHTTEPNAKMSWNGGQKELLLFMEKHKCNAICSLLGINKQTVESKPILALTKEKSKSTIVIDPDEMERIQNSERLKTQIAAFKNISEWLPPEK